MEVGVGVPVLLGVPVGVVVEEGVPDFEEVGVGVGVPVFEAVGVIEEVLVLDMLLVDVGVGVLVALGTNVQLDAPATLVYPVGQAVHAVLP